MEIFCRRQSYHGQLNSGKVLNIPRWKIPHPRRNLNIVRARHGCTGYTVNKLVEFDDVFLVLPLWR